MPFLEDSGIETGVDATRATGMPGGNWKVRSIAREPHLRQLPEEIPNKDRDHARQLEQANEELKRANRELEEFAYVASHDFREPLRMINIYTQLLLQECAPSTEKACLFAKHIEYSVARMEQLIGEVLQFSQISHGGGEFPLSAVPLQRPWEYAVAVFRDQIDAAAVEFEVDKLPTVFADETQLSVVFQHLLSNSLKYAHPDRRLLIRVWADRAGDYWNIHFTDNGLGFEPRFAERIFGLFKRLHGREVPGTGLGLALCRRIIERHGGAIRAIGQPQNGATFIFSLKGSSGNGPVLEDLTGRGQSG